MAAVLRHLLHGAILVALVVAAVTLAAIAIL
jgi:hypothetical protein